MKHAVLIMAHDNYEGLCRLIRLLDEDDTDIFLHINKNSTDWNDEIVAGVTEKSKVTVVPRVAISYCNYTQVEAIKSLLKEATRGGYDYYHIISGSDLPLRKLKALNTFFKSHPGALYINFDSSYNCSKAGLKFFFSNSIRTSRGLKQKFYVYTNKILINLQQRLRINLARKFSGIPKKGADWWSITHDAATFVLEQEPTFRTYFRHTYCPSELLVQTIVYNSPLKKNIYSLDNIPMAALREIDWTRGRPYIWRNEDFDYLKDSSCLFARKFDANIDNEIITQIINHIQHQ